LSKPPQITKINPSVGCHESWRNDFTPPVSFIIGAIPGEISAGLTSYTTNPVPIATRRQEVAKAIETLTNETNR
jgi:hypothetical protein